MARVFASYRPPHEGKYQPLKVHFGDLSKPETLTVYEFKTDGTNPASCEVKDADHLAKLLAAGYSAEPQKGEDLAEAEAQAKQIKAEAAAKEKAEQARLNKAAEAKRKLAQAKVKPNVTTMASIQSDE